MGIDYSESVVLICDGIRSIPLFYSMDVEKIYVSTSGERIGRQIHAGFHKENMEEFLRTGYVTENDTLFDNVYQVGPGEIVTIYKKDGSVRKQHFFQLLYKQEIGAGEKEWIEWYDSVLQNVFRDLIHRLNGRTALIPLSGGCDSRTVAVMLKRLGYENVVCFVYGRKGCKEAEISRKVADNLGFRWYFVEYSGKKWKNFYESGQFLDFLKFSCLGVGIGCVQALPAVLELRKSGLMPEDGVVIPGHAQDFNAGSHIPVRMGAHTFHKEYFVKLIMDGHYILSRKRDHPCSRAVEKWKTGLPARMDKSRFVMEYQKWEWKNRQSKFIANDVRAYEFVGLEWELPFWDLRNCEFWMKVPLEMLQGRSLQYSHMKERIDPVCSLKINYPNTSYGSNGWDGKRWIKASIRKTVPWAAAIRKYAERRKEHFTNEDAFYDYLTNGEFRRCFRKYGIHFTINSIIADTYISHLQNTHHPHQ